MIQSVMVACLTTTRRGDSQQPRGKF